MDLFSGVLLRNGSSLTAEFVAARFVRRTDKAIYLERVDSGVRCWFPADALVPIGERVGEYRLRHWFLAKAAMEQKYIQFFASTAEARQ